MKITAQSNPAQPTAVFGQFLRCRSNNFGLPLASYTEPRLGSHMRGPGQSMLHQVVDFLKKKQNKASRGLFLPGKSVCRFATSPILLGNFLPAPIQRLPCITCFHQPQATSRTICVTFSHFRVNSFTPVSQNRNSQNREQRTTISRETQRSVPRALIDCRRRASGDERTPVSRRFLAGEITGFRDGHASSSSSLSTRGNRPKRHRQLSTRNLRMIQSLAD